MSLARTTHMAQSSRRRQHQVRTPDEKTPAKGGVGHWFSSFSQNTAELAGSPWAFIVAVSSILVWLITGPVFGFSDTWQLVANTVTTLVTTLMVFLIQNTQNRDARAIHLKLDELLRATPEARNEFMDAEEEDLDEIEREKAIVDEADPAPPAQKKADKKEDQKKKVAPGNGKTHLVPGNGTTHRS